MTDKELHEKMVKYQKLLCLTEWQILFAVSDELEGLGWSGVTPESLLASIVINSVDSIDGRKHDKEVTIVHELLHLYFDAIVPKDKTQNLLLHQKIELLARVIVNAYRDK